MHLLIMLGATLASGQPPPDCTHPASQTEQALCVATAAAKAAGDEANFSDELTRLYPRARAGVRPARRAVLDRHRREGVAERRACWLRGGAPSDCVRDSYLGEVAELRMTVPVPVAGEISSRPIRYRCDGGYPDLWLTLFAGESRQAWIAVPSRNEGQPLALAEGSDVYAGRYDSGETFDQANGTVHMNSRTCRPVGAPPRVIPL